MEQIITLGIGGTPATLTPFITTGLEIGAGPVVRVVRTTARFFVNRITKRFFTVSVNKS